MTFHGPGEKILDIHPKEATIVSTIEPAKLTLLNNRQKGILKYLLKNIRITREECMKHFGITKDTAYRSFKRLIEVNLIEKKGTGRATYYVLKES